MKKLAAAILLISFMCGVFCKTAIVLDYYSNTAAFAKNCINKNKPALHCNGKCQMMKKLRQEEKKDDTNPERKTDGKNEVLSSKSFFTASILPGQTVRNISSVIVIEKPVDRSYTFLRPPSIV